MTTAYPNSYQIGAVIGSELPMSSGDATCDYLPKLIAKENELASGAYKRYLQAQKGHFLWNYSYLYGRKFQVYDGGLGYYDLLALWENPSQVYSFVAPRKDQSQGQKTYSVMFALDSWRSKCVFSTPSGDIEAFQLSFELREV